MEIVKKMAGSGIRKVVLIGAGNLAINLAFALQKNGFRIIQVYNRTPRPGELLAKKVSSEYTSDIDRIFKKADLYVLAVKDTAIDEMAQKLSIDNGFIVHTSGTVDMKVLKKASSNYGVFYPVQTFLKTKRKSFRDVPLCIEANNKGNETLLQNMAGRLSGHVYKVNSQQRKIIHIAAVFSCNFVNYLNSVAEDLLLENGLDFDILGGLIRETWRNTGKGNIFRNQTGPATREDHEVMNEHLFMLSGHPDHKQIYELISKAIIKRKKQYG